MADGSADTGQSHDTLTTALLACGVVAGPLFVAVFMIEGATRPGYDPVGMVISLLSLGSGGWVQVVNFVVDGILLLAFAIGLRRVWDGRTEAGSVASTLFATIGIALIGAGFFTTDPGGGYPPLTAVPRTTLHSSLHELASLFVFAPMPLAIAAASRHLFRVGERPWAWYAAISAAVAGVITLVLLSGAGGPSPIDPVVGLIQRVWVVICWGWITVMSAHLVRSRAAPG